MSRADRAARWPPRRSPAALGLRDGCRTPAPTTGRPRRPVGHRAVPATSANLGPGFDSFGLALGRATTRSRPAAADGGLPIEVRGVGAGGTRCRGPPTISSSGRSRRVADSPASRCPAVHLRCVNVHPARRRPGLVRGGDRRRPAAGPRAARGRRRPRLSDDDLLALAPRWRAIPTTLPPPCSAASPWPTWTATADRSPSGARCTPTSGRSCSARTQASSTHHARGLLPADRAARRRCGERGQPPGCWCTR